MIDINKQETNEGILFTMSENTPPKPLTFKKKYNVQMVVECRPSLIDHLLEELCATAQYENALIETYSYEEVDDSQPNN